MAEPRTAARKSPRRPKGSAGAANAEAPRTEGRDGETRDGHVCPVAFCPIGMALSSVQQAGPDVIDHLLAAAGEFFLAARAVMDARGSDFDPKKDGGGLQRIEIH